MSTATFTIKIYRGGLKKSSSVEFHSCNNPRVVDFSNQDPKGHEVTLHKEFIDKGATHAVDVLIDMKLDHLYLFETDVMFIESPHGETIFSVNRKEK